METKINIDPDDDAIERHDAVIQYDEGGKPKVELDDDGNVRWRVGMAVQCCCTIVPHDRLEAAVQNPWFNGKVLRVYENGEVDVCIPPNIPEQIMSKVEACQERMKHERIDPRAVMPQEITNESKAGGGEDDEWDGVQESKADVPSRKRRHKTKKKKQMLFSALMKTAIAARRRVRQKREVSLRLELFPDERSFGFQRVLAIERANADFKRRVILQKKTKAVVRMQVLYRKRQSSRILEKMKLKRASQTLVECNGPFIKHWKMNTSASGWPRHTKLVITEGKPLYVERVTKKKRGKSKAKTLGEMPLPARFPHTEVKLVLKFTAPSKTREHNSTWRAQLPDGTLVGNEFKLELYVVKKIGAATLIQDLGDE